MTYHVPPEPVEWKESVKSRRDFNSPTDSWMIWIEKDHPPAKLWREWKDELEAIGYDYQEYEKQMRSVEKDIGRWILNEKSWDELVTEISSKLKDK